MEIEIKRQQVKKTLNQVKTGEVFLFSNRYYLKVSPKGSASSFNISQNILENLNLECVVEIVNAKLIIT